MGLIHHINLNSSTPVGPVSESHLYKVEVELKGRWPQGTESSEGNNPMHVSHMWAHFW